MSILKLNNARLGDNDARRCCVGTEKEINNLSAVLYFLFYRIYIEYEEGFISKLSKTNI